MQRETYKVRDLQSIYDIALQTHGSMEGVIDLLVMNSLDFNSSLPSTITYDTQDNIITRNFKNTVVTTCPVYTEPAVEIRGGSFDSTSWDEFSFDTGFYGVSPDAGAGEDLLFNPNGFEPSGFDLESFD